MISSLKRLLLLVAVIILILIALFAFGALGTHLEMHRRVELGEELKSIEDRLRVDAGDTGAMSRLVDHLGSEQSYERAQAAIVAGQIGPNAAATVERLIRLLADDDAAAAREAAVALGKIGPAAAEAVPALIDAVQRRADVDVGWFAAEALGAVADTNDAAARDCLNKALAHPNHVLSQMAATGLKTIDDRSLPAAAPPTTLP